MPSRHRCLEPEQFADAVGAGPSSQGMISYTLPEIRRLLTGLAWRYLPDPEHVLAWSNWRRRRQYQACVSHYRRRGYALT